MQKKDVTVQVLGCRNVLARDGATSDCYCKIKSVAPRLLRLCSLAAARARQVT
jgi:hypothetical protein